MGKNTDQICWSLDITLQRNWGTGSGLSKACSSVVWQGNNMGGIIYSFNLNLSPKMSYGVLECAIVMLENYMLMIL